MGYPDDHMMEESRVNRAPPPRTPLAWQHCKQPPKVVCLCGSTRFLDQFFRSGWAETLAGNIVLSIGVVVDHPGDAEGGHVGEALGLKDQLDELHFRKIDLADDVLVLNLDGYIGKSTQREIAYAMATGKPVRFLNEEEGRVILDRRSDEIVEQVHQFVKGKVPPLCVLCDDTGEALDVVPGPHGEGEEIHGPCPNCDPAGGARKVDP